MSFALFSDHAFAVELCLFDQDDPTRVRARALLLEGIPADRIVRAAKSQGVDLVVIGTHGRTGFSRLVLGSVASCVISQARCP